MKGKSISIAFIAFLVGTVFTVCFETARSSSVGTNWIKYSENPLDLEPERTVESWVIYEPGIFKMWYTGIDNLGIHRIYYATSTDGVNWTSYGIVLDIGDPGSWDESSVRRPVVFFDGTDYKMWYLGPAPHKIGLATSSDGIVWTKHAGNPVLVPGGNGGWDDAGLGEFTVFFNGSTYIMWYNGVVSTQKIGVATSTDGISWIKYSGNPVLVPGPSGWDNYHIYTGPVIKNETSYQMWYSGQQSSTVRVGLATSLDGFSWTKQSGNPVLDIGTPETWDSAYIFAMCVVKKADRLLMWYWGGSNPAGGTERIGLATSYAIADVDINPDTLNLKSNGQWITAYVTLPEGYSVEDVDVSTIQLKHDDTVVVAADWAEVQDSVLMVKFDRATLRDYLGVVDVNDGDKFYDITLTVTGNVAGTPFEGTDIITVKKK